ncbi:hypothetical protein [Arthrobacter sunyaminii]|uniref:hypothetical protein n=1 Tax=Arthrobacter sunyaminii TaxID=2816859 RepID=UPI001A945F42|nr:hypothetical protein [Arthrobacter sunyaminii]MBO0895132.1 hypothetical protein [Arthrobacter sunyaminii]
MKQSTQRDAAVVLLFTAAAGVVLIVRGNETAAWVFCAYCFVLALMHIRRERRTRRRYAARNQCECRVLAPTAAFSRPRWARALATPYPDWLTLQPLSGGRRAHDDPLVVRTSDFAGIRKASFSESLFRFNPGWRVASFHRDGGEVLIAAPPALLTSFTGPASSRRPEHSSQTPEDNQ